MAGGRRQDVCDIQSGQVSHMWHVVTAAYLTIYGSYAVMIIANMVIYVCNAA